VITKSQDPSTILAKLQEIQQSQMGSGGDKPSDQS